MNSFEESFVNSGKVVFFIFLNFLFINHAAQGTSINDGQVSGYRVLFSLKTSQPAMGNRKEK